MSLRVDLSNHPEKFVDSSQVFTIEKKLNFVFGRNGTGKTTISDEIKLQLSNDYDVSVFKDFEGVAVNARLDAVALGQTNSKIQKEIDVIDDEISLLENEILEPPLAGVINNLFTKSKAADLKVRSALNQLDKFYTSAAKSIKDLTISISRNIYNKNDFKNDIKFAESITDEEKKDRYRTLREAEMEDPTIIDFPKLHLQEYLDETREILRKSVAQPIDIPELRENPAKQEFARKGMSIHQEKEGEVCAFCGEKIPLDRWDVLSRYFNDQVKEIENDIVREINKLDDIVNRLSSIHSINTTEFYAFFSEEVKTINLSLDNIRLEVKEFLDSLKKKLEGKRSSLFVPVPFEQLTIPQGFESLVKEYNQLLIKQKSYNENLKIKQEESKNILRFHEVKSKLDAFEYETKLEKLIELETTARNLNQDLNLKTQEWENKKAQRRLLLAETIDEEKIANRISTLLRNTGVTSFSLELVRDDAENQKGQYRVKGYTDEYRDVTQLSKGEQNIIAFLYFLFSLDSVNRGTKKRIIVLDDPMTSNDDTMQYLLIGEIKKFYEKLKEGNHLVVLTHNCHFYLNVRPVVMQKNKKNADGTIREEGYYERVSVRHLFSDGRLTTIRSIHSGKEDFQTNYESLWKELVFLYDTNHPDLMLNPCRRICETYLKFTKQNSNQFYADNPGAKKLFDVNVHSIDDLEIDQNGKTREQIIETLRQLFISANGEAHFNNHWNIQ